MKKTRSLAALLLVFTLACAANKASYVALGVTVHTVDVGMRGWASYVVTEHPSADKEQKVKDAYKKYQDTAHILQVTLEATSQLPTPPELAAAANSLIALIEEITGKKVTP